MNALRRRKNRKRKIREIEARALGSYAQLRDIHTADDVYALLAERVGVRRRGWWQRLRMCWRERRYRATRR